MKPEVKERLVTGLAQYLSAQSAGSSRFAIADGYLAVDNYFAALLIDRGIDDKRNHQIRLRKTHEHFGELFSEAKVTYRDLENFYLSWQAVRYSSVAPSPKEAWDYLRLADRIIDTIIAEFACREGESDQDLEQELHCKVLGSRWLSFDQACDDIHELWQQKAELLAESGYGTMIGNKVTNPARFSEVRAFADDQATKQILATDVRFGAAVAKFYNSFLELVEQVQNARFRQGIDPNEVTNFMLSLRLRYHGQTLQEMAEDWQKMIAQAMEETSEQGDS